MAFSLSQIDLDLEIKITLVGNPSVGKTSIIEQYINKRFDFNVSSTIGESHFSKYIRINNENILVTLWDTAGQERYKSLNTIFLKNSNIVIFVYDITSINSFNNLKEWIKETKEIIENDYVCGIVGNKNDLYKQQEISDKEGMEFAQSIGMNFKLVSAKEDKEGFIEFVQDLIKEAIPNLEKKRDSILIEKKKNKKHKCKC